MVVMDNDEEPTQYRQSVEEPPGVLLLQWDGLHHPNLPPCRREIIQRLMLSRPWDRSDHAVPQLLATRPRIGGDGTTR